MAKKKFLVRIGTGADAVYVSKIRSSVHAADAFAVLPDEKDGKPLSDEKRGTVKDKAKARAFDTIGMATTVAKRNKGTVVEVTAGKATDAADQGGDIE